MVKKVTFTSVLVVSGLLVSGLCASAAFADSSTSTSSTVASSQQTAPAGLQPNNAIPAQPGGTALLSASLPQSNTSDVDDAQTTWVTSSTEEIDHWKTKTWAYSCPSDYPYFDGSYDTIDPSTFDPVWNNLSSSGVTATINGLKTTPYVLDVEFHNWAITGNQVIQVNYRCSTQSPSN